MASPEPHIQHRGRLAGNLKIEAVTLRFNADMEAPSGLAPKRLGEEIDALAARYELADGAAVALQGLVGLVDWGEANFVPKPNPAHRRRNERRTASWRRVASVLAESLAGLELEPVREARRLADIGSGAGFPGMVLAIALPQARVALIEKVPEKCDFLHRAVAELGLQNVEVVEGPLQDWSEGVGACDVVTSRKMGRPNTIVEWSAPLLSPGGAVVLWQGRRDPAKETLAADAADAAGLSLADVHPIASENRQGTRVDSKHLYVYARTDGS
jgi:16S rRNA (guanine527-N7)-methyltransferase